MNKGVSVVLVTTGLLLGGAVSAQPQPTTPGHEGHEAHESSAQKGGMHQRHHGHGMKGEPMMPMFGMLDENKDGKLSKEEMQKGVDKMFADADANKDGVITREEMQAHRARMHDKMRAKMQDLWKAADKDGDGALSRAEADNADMPMLSRHFDRIDKNKDGKLTQDELRNGMMQHRPPAPPQPK